MCGVCEREIEGERLGQLLTKVMNTFTYQIFDQLLINNY